MNDLVDERLIATKVTQTAIDRALVFAEKLVKQRWAKFRNQFKEDYEGYLLNKTALCRAVRNFIYDTRSVDIDSIYVETGVCVRDRYSKAGVKTYFEDDILNIISGNRIIDSAR